MFLSDDAGRLTSQYIAISSSGITVQPAFAGLAGGDEGALWSARVRRALKGLSLWERAGVRALFYNYFDPGRNPLPKSV